MGTTLGRAAKMINAGQYRIIARSSHIGRIMDPLSRLVSLLDLKGRLDLRCLFGRQWQASHDEVGPWRAPYHILLRGECEVWLPRQDERVLLRQGSLLILPHGTAHILRTGGEAPPSPIRQRSGAVVELKTNLARPTLAEVEILCGEFEFGGRQLRPRVPAPNRRRPAAAADRPAHGAGGAAAGRRRARYRRRRRSGGLPLGGGIQSRLRPLRRGYARTLPARGGRFRAPIQSTDKARSS
jgi:hypothetical protein